MLLLKLVALLGSSVMLNCFFIVHQVVQMRQALLRYKHILCADDHYSSWQEVTTQFSLKISLEKKNKRKQKNFSSGT